MKFISLMIVYAIFAYCPINAQDTSTHPHVNALPGQIVHDPNNQTRLVLNKDSDGEGQLDPFFLCGPGDPEGFLYRGKRNPDGTRNGDQMKLIRKLKKHGGNSIYLMAVRTHGGDAPKDHQSHPETYPDALHNPWIDQKPENGLNEKILDQWEEWFAEMDKNGIVIYFFFFDDAINMEKRFGWPLDNNGNLHPDQKNFVQALVRRFQHHKHLIWCVMEEGQEIGKEWREHVSKIAEAIREADDHNHIIASHQLGGNVFFHKDDPFISQFALQTDKNRVLKTSDLYHWMMEAFRYSEGAYSIVMSEDFVHGNISVPNNDRLEFRQRSWVAAMAGAYIMVFGMDIENTPKSWLKDLRVIQNFFESTQFNQMQPCELSAHGETMYVLSNPGFDYILYSSVSDNNLGVKNASAGKYSLTWMDCITGRKKVKKNVTLTDGDNVWEKPSGFGKEVVLYIQRQDQRPAIKKFQYIPKQGDEKLQKGNIAPVAESAEFQVSRNTEIAVQLRYVDPDGGPGPYSIEIVTAPKNGTLSGVGNDRFYKPNKDYTGEDQFIWKVHDGKDESNLAVIKIILIYLY